MEEFSEDLHRDTLRCRRYRLSAAADLKSALLGRNPRYAPDRSFDTLHVKLKLQVDFAERSVSGVCATTVRAFEGGLAELTFDACAMSVLGAQDSGGARLRFIHKGGRLTIKLRKSLAAGEQAVVDIRYKLTRPKAGLHFVAPAGGHGPQLWSQGQPEDSRYWFPCHDAPHEKATTEVLATVPKGFVAVSNGMLIEKTSGTRTDTFHWRMSRPHSLYLVSLAVGRFAEVTERWEDVPISYYCERGRENDARRGFAKTPKVMEFYSRKTGVRYPYEKYAQVAVAEYPGGMENTTCTTQTDACLIPEEAALDNDMDLLVAHELAHQWFGDLLTCRDWSHAWLNEGFATYFEILFAEHDKGKEEADYELWLGAQSYFHEDETRYRRPIVCNTYKYPWVLFDRHLYEKGGWVLHMLRRSLGDAAWWKAIQLYLTRFRDKSVETSDLIASIEESSGRNLKPFFDQWIFRAGYPSYQVFYSLDARAKTAWFRVIQKGSEPFFSMPVSFRFTGPGARWVKEFTHTVDQKEHDFKFKLPGEPALAEFDPDYRILKKAEIHKPLALWLGELRGAQGAVGRIQAAKAVAHWGDETAVRALGAASRAEKFWGAAVEMARALGSIGTERAFAELKSLLALRHPKVRRAVIAALANFRKPETASTVLPYLTKDRSLHVRAEAARTLGHLRERKWLAPIRAKLKSRSYWDILAGGAIQGLANTRDPGALPALFSACRPPFTYPARAYALRALGQFAQISEEVVPKLCRLLEDILQTSDERLAMAAIQTLGGCNDLRALPVLEKTLRAHPDTRIKTYAEEALARIRGESEKDSAKKK